MELGAEINLVGLEHEGHMQWLLGALDHSPCMSRPPALPIQLDRGAEAFAWAGTAIFHYLVEPSGLAGLGVMLVIT